MIDPKQIIELRSLTGAGVMDCREALEECSGNKEKAIEYLRQKGYRELATKQERSTKEGLVDSYLHHGAKVGVLVQLRCETDFVARNEAFRALAHDIAMHVAATNPIDTSSLLAQPFVKDEAKKISDLLAEAVTKLGENIQIERFVRFEI